MHFQQELASILFVHINDLQTAMQLCQYSLWTRTKNGGDSNNSSLLNHSSKKIFNIAKCKLLMWEQIRQAVRAGQEAILANCAFEKDLEVVTDNNFNMIFLYPALAEALLQWGAIHRIRLSCNLHCAGKTYQITLTRFVSHIQKKRADSRQSSIERQKYSRRQKKKSGILISKLVT